MSAAMEKAVTLGFLEARAPGSGKAAREHLSLSNVSSQVTLIGTTLECGCLVTGFQILLGSVVKEVTALPGIPSLSPLLD